MAGSIINAMMAGILIFGAEKRNRILLIIWIIWSVSQLTFSIAMVTLYLAIFFVTKPVSDDQFTIGTIFLTTCIGFWIFTIWTIGVVKNAKDEIIYEHVLDLTPEQIEIITKVVMNPHALKQEPNLSQRLSVTS